MTLAVVPNPEPEDRLPKRIPTFHGKEVALTRVKVASVSGLEAEDLVLGPDDIVRLQVDARVTSVNHQVNETTGDLERIHTVKAVDVEIVPWDPNDPNDTGVLR